MIINEVNNNKLEVGSSCITKFPSINDKYKGESIKKIERWNKTSPEKLDRLGYFHDIFGGGKDIYQSWESIYNSYTIEFPNAFDNEFKLIIKNAGKIYKDFINCKSDINSLIEFKKCLREANYFFDKADEFYCENKINKYICTKEIGNLLRKLNYKNMLSIIKDSECLIQKDFAKYINNKEFIARFKKDIENCFERINLKLEAINENNIIFSIKYMYFEKVFIESSLSKFTNLYSDIFYVKRDLDFKKTMDSMMLLINKNNINEFLRIINFIIKDTGYYLYFDEFINDDQIITIRRKGIKKSATLTVNDLIANNYL